MKLGSAMSSAIGSAIKCGSAIDSAMSSAIGSAMDFYCRTYKICRTIMFSAKHFPQMWGVLAKMFRAK
ncbi:MAG: hypothetical protein ACP5QN_02915, partial [Minisyncoccia bacterium]